MEKYNYIRRAVGVLCALQTLQIRGFNAGELSVSQLIELIFNLFINDFTVQKSKSFINAALL